MTNINLVDTYIYSKSLSKPTHFGCEMKKNYNYLLYYCKLKPEPVRYEILNQQWSFNSF